MTATRWVMVRGVARRDLTAARRSPGVVAPMIVVPVVLCVVLPVVVGVVARSGADALGLDQLGELVPASVAEAASEPAVQVALLLATYVFPTLLVVVPLMVVSVISSDSIAGERERGTLEGVLLTPLSDRELFLGKVLSAAVPAAMVHVLASTVYLVGISAATWGRVEGPPLPSTAWLLVVVWVAPAFTMAGLGLAVHISARSRSVQGASQVSGVAVLPLLLLVMGQMAGVGLLSGWLVGLLGLLLWAAAILSVRAGARSLSRPRLASVL